MSSYEIDLVVDAIEIIAKKFLVARINENEQPKGSDPIVQYEDINIKSMSYASAAGASHKEQPNFRPLTTGPVFDGVNISIPRKLYVPPRCDECKIFGHVHDHYPKKVDSPYIATTSNVVTPIVKKTNDGFRMVGKKRRRKSDSRFRFGFLVMLDEDDDDGGCGWRRTARKAVGEDDDAVTNNESLDLPDLVTNRNKSLLVPDLVAKKLNSWVSFGEKDQL
nr:hypothetical protein [Tanacetum cinerariifolium]